MNRIPRFLSEKESPLQVQSPGREDCLEKQRATHSSILAWEIPWTEEPGGLYSPWGCCKEVDRTEHVYKENRKSSFACK